MHANATGSLLHSASACFWSVSCHGQGSLNPSFAAGPQRCRRSHGSSLHERSDGEGRKGVHGLVSNAPAWTPRPPHLGRLRQVLATADDGHLATCLAQWLLPAGRCMCKEAMHRETMQRPAQAAPIATALPRHAQGDWVGRRHSTDHAGTRRDGTGPHAELGQARPLMEAGRALKGCGACGNAQNRVRPLQWIAHAIIRARSALKRSVLEVSKGPPVSSRAEVHCRGSYQPFRGTGRFPSERQDSLGTGVPPYTSRHPPAKGSLASGGASSRACPGTQ